MENPLGALIRREIRESTRIQQALYESNDILAQIERIVELMVTAYQSGHKVLLAGNGGSAADAQHLAAELVGRLNRQRAALAAIALTTDTSILTAVSNDSGFENIFLRQIEALGHEGDIFVGISTSGNSENLLAAIRACREKGLGVVGLTGKSGGKMAPLCDVAVSVPSQHTQRIQESHILIGHAICAAVEQALFGEGF
ncbi:MAG: SIS domain-containing protein [bacterium]